MIDHQKQVTAQLIFVVDISLPGLMNSEEKPARSLATPNGNTNNSSAFAAWQVANFYALRYSM